MNIFNLIGKPAYKAVF